MTPAAATVIKYRFVAYLVILVIALALILAENRAYRDPAVAPVTRPRAAAAPGRDSGPALPSNGPRAGR